jgi:hypothetical membrane protein
MTQRRLATTLDSMSTPRSNLAVAAIVGQLVFVGGWLVLGLLEGRGYAPGRHDISDLGALTAQHATIDRLTLFVSGAVTIAFALSLRADLGRPAWLVALSLPGLDGLSDAFFRVDCRAADPGCGFADATDSWHGTVHVVVFVVAALATVGAPFVLARRMRQTDGWQSLAGGTRIFGVLTVAALGVTMLSSGTALQGWTQRGAAVLVASGIVMLAWHVVRLERRTPRGDTVSVVP